MADIVELTIKRLPYELVNEVFSFLGRSPSAKIIEEAKDDLDENGLVVGVRYSGNDISRFYDCWKLVARYNFDLYNGVPKYIDIQTIFFDMSNLSCVGCHCHINLRDFYNYGERCEWCYALYLGHEVLECDICRNYKTLDFDDMFLQGETWICRNCEIPSETEDEESEIDEEEFWD